MSRSKKAKCKVVCTSKGQREVREMIAMVLREFCEVETAGAQRLRLDIPLKKEPLEMVEISSPLPGLHQILVKISACGICHTELDEIEGRLVPPRFPVVLGHEKEIKSVANVTRQDAKEFLPLAAEIGIIPEIQEFDLEQANQALVLLKQGKMQGERAF